MFLTSNYIMDFVFHSIFIYYLFVAVFLTVFSTNAWLLTQCVVCIYVLCCVDMSFVNRIQSSLPDISEPSEIGNTCPAHNQPTSAFIISTAETPTSAELYDGSEVTFVSPSSSAYTVDSRYRYAT